MVRFYRLVILNGLISFLMAAPPKVVQESGKTPVTSAPVLLSQQFPASLLDLLMPSSGAKANSNSNSFNGQSILNLPGLSPTTSPTPSKTIVNGVDLGQLTRLCQTMAAANRAKQMSMVAQSAAAQPNDMSGWMQLVQHTEPIALENFACTMIERVITNPQAFVSDLLRVFMPMGTADLLQPFNFPIHTTPNPPQPSTVPTADNTGPDGQNNIESQNATLPKSNQKNG